MNRYILVLAVTIFMAIAFIGSCYGETNTIRTEGPLSVADIQADPFAYRGTVTINGMVAGISKQDPKMFAVVETK